MFFKNLLLGLGGTAAIGGIGYGVYASSQSSKEGIKIDEQESGNNDGNEDSVQREENADGNKGNNGASGEKSSTSDKTPTGTEPAT